MDSVRAEKLRWSWVIGRRCVAMELRANGETLIDAQAVLDVASELE